MRRKPRSPLLTLVSAAIENRMGVYFPEERLQDLERSIRFAAKELGYSDMGTFMEWLLSASLSRNQIEVLARHLTVGETYFFRDKGTLDALNEEVLPKLILSRKDRERRLRIWSAGCSTGEEAYSVAILLDRLVPDLKEWGVTILATDINTRCLDAARRGVYHDWSFRNTPQWVKDIYFERTERGFEILPRIRKMVTFSYHNLLDDPYPSVANNTSAMDLVFCRNVLMYFSHARAWDVIRRLHRCILDEGWFITGPVEASKAMNSLFTGIRFRQAVLYRKAHENTQIEKSEIGRRGDRRRDANKEPPVSEIPVQAETPVTLPEGPLLSEPIPLSSLAREAANEGRLSEAIELCDKAIATDKLNAPLYYLKATVLMETGKLDEAAASLRHAIYVDQDFVLAHFSLGHLLNRQEKHKQAKRYFDTACTLLTRHEQDYILPESDGISAARLMEIIQGTRKSMNGAAA